MSRGAGPAAALAATASLVGVGVLAPVGVPAVALVAARNTARTNRRIPAVVEALGRLADGADATGPFDHVRRLPAGTPGVVTSDLHRCIAGANDWPRRQGTAAIYDVALDHYGAAGWHLVEDGDVEDLWMVGGSTRGAAYGLGRLGAASLPGRVGRATRTRLRRRQLRAIVEHNVGTYRRIEQRFHRHGRYHRVVGNHDDVLADPAVADELRLVHAGLEVLDAVVVDRPGGPGAVITHGHHTDAWNAPDMAALGRLGTWLACHVRDVPLLGLDPGLADEQASRRLLGGHQLDRLTAVSRWFGANLEQYSMDEVRLFDAAGRRWPSVTDPDGADDPVLVLGHTHLPLASPTAPDGRRWWRYLNSGSGVASKLVTAVELDGVGSPRLVAWGRPDDLPPHLADLEPTAADAQGRPVVRVELGPDADGSHLVAEAVVVAGG